MKKIRRNTRGQLALFCFWRCRGIWRLRGRVTIALWCGSRDGGQWCSWYDTLELHLQRWIRIRSFHFTSIYAQPWPDAWWEGEGEEQKQPSAHFIIMTPFSEFATGSCNVVFFCEFPLHRWFHKHLVPKETISRPTWPHVIALFLKSDQINSHIHFTTVPWGFSRRNWLSISNCKTSSSWKH